MIMDITKETIDRILELSENRIHKINGETYSEKDLIRIPEIKNSPQEIKLNSLDSIVHLIKSEIDKIAESPVYIEIESHKSVNVFTGFSDDFRRVYLYKAVSDTPKFEFGWKDYESAMIAFRSQFAQEKGTEYLLDILSRITSENNVTSDDNGVTQTVEVRKGISLAAKGKIKPRVSLRPYRTFLEIEQPESEFLVRLDEDKRIGLFEADGGMWTIEAKQKIKAYFMVELSELVKSGKVIVMM